MAQMISSVTPMAGGVTGVAGVGKTFEIEFTTDNPGVTNWAFLDEATLTFTYTLTGFSEEVGFGFVSGKKPTFCLTFADKVYVLGGSSVYFCETGDPTQWNDPLGIGNGFVNLVNYYSSPEPLAAVATYQGKLAFFSRTTTQIWDVPQDPTAWALVQTLPNIGTIAKRSVQSLGDLEVFFLADSGIRSLRARETVLNAIVTDIGSPIDALVQEKLETATEDEREAACGVVEPSANRYWLFLKDTIWVLSYFPSNKIAAWSQYAPTYADDVNVQQTFTPTQFVVHNGIVVGRGVANGFIVETDALFRYGGEEGTTYDGSVCEWELPWSFFKTPATFKTLKGLDIAFTGAWVFSVGVDPTSGILAEAYRTDVPTFRGGVVPVSGYGTHVKVRGETTGATAAKTSSAIVHYEENDAQ